MLLAESEADLQKMLHTLQQLCELMGLMVNEKKSAAVIFNNNYEPRSTGMTPTGDSGPSSLMFNGAPLTVNNMFVYLGVLFEVGGVANVAHRCLARESVDIMVW